jgi:hypothetical protein
MVTMLLSEREKVLLEALESLGPGWHSRAELAANLNKKRLNGAEVMLLDVMTEQGRLERKLIPGGLPHLQQYVYRIPEGVK